MKKSRRIICMLLAVLMLTSVLSVSAFAKTISANVRQYNYYTVLGDSIAAGFGLDEYHSIGGGYMHDGERIPGSYPDLVADAVGATTVDIRSHCGWRTTEFLREMEYDGFEWDVDEYAAFCSSDFLRTSLGVISEDNLVGEKDRMTDGITKADLITMQYGANDVFSYAMNAVLGKFGDVLGVVSGLTSVASVEDFNKAVAALFELSSESMIRGIIGELVNCMETGFAMYKKNLPKVMETIRGLNSNADVLILGVSSPMHLADSNVLLESLYLPTDLLVDRMNTYTKQVCKDYGCTYVEMGDTEYYGLDLNGNLWNFLKMVHPNEAGHRYMADQILDVLHALNSAPAVTGRYSSIIKRNTLNWTPVDGAVRYNIYRSTCENGTYLFVGTATGDIFYDYLTLPGITYYYKVTAVFDTFGKLASPMSDPVALKAK